nr:MAG TPA: hypothetical protein [Caudoviricetes sp.]
MRCLTDRRMVRASSRVSLRIWAGSSCRTRASRRSA